MKFFWATLQRLSVVKKNAEETVNEVRRIGIIIKAESVNDLLKANLIRDVYLGVCNEKGYKPDSIRKYLKSYTNSTAS